MHYTCNPYGTNFKNYRGAIDNEARWFIKDSRGNVVCHCPNEREARLMVMDVRVNATRYGFYDVYHITRTKISKTK